MRGITETGYLMVGDLDTVRAQASINAWAPLVPPIVKFDSDTAPQRFQYSSSSPSVAWVDRRGVVTASNPGITTLRASCEGVTSNQLVLTVSPKAARLVARPERISAKVGDTLTITVTALDANGSSVVGVPFTVRVDATWWAVVSPPRESWTLTTPVVLHSIARMAGRVRLLTVSMHERATDALQARPVSVVVHAP